MRDDFFGDGLQMPSTVFPWAGDAEYDMAGARVDIFLDTGDATFHRAQ
jgi:hypothetical protein